MDIYFCKINEIEPFSDYENLFLSYLPETRKKQIKNFKFHSDKRRSLFAHILICYAFHHTFHIAYNDLTFEINTNGKIFQSKFDNMHFNISHSGKYVVCGIGTSEIGIDIEKKQNIDLSISRYFHPDESKKILETKNLEYFFELWTLKESYLKYLGTGLSYGLDTFKFKKKGNSYLIELTNTKEGTLNGPILYSLEIDPTYSAAVCSDQTGYPKLIECNPSATMEWFDTYTHNYLN